MPIPSPRISKTLTPVHDFADVSARYREEDAAVSSVLIQKADLEKCDFSFLDLRGSRFLHCRMNGSLFRKASFVDVEFRDCDLSLCRFDDAYFERCRFVSCKGMNLGITDSRIRNTTFALSKLPYSQWDQSKLTDVDLDGIDLESASMANMRLIRFTVSNSRFIRTNFFKTMLNGVDFSRCELLAPIVSSPPEELRGAKIGAHQAIDLVTLFGVQVLE